jgi:hypothetical protein
MQKDSIWLLRRQNPELRPAARPPPPCPEALWELIQRCWDRRPDARPNFSQILDDLRSIQAELGDAPAEDPPYVRAADPPAVARPEAAGDPASPAPPRPLLVASPQAVASPFLAGPLGLVLSSQSQEPPSAEPAPQGAAGQPTPFLSPKFPMSGFKSMSKLNNDEVECLRSLFSSQPPSSGASDAKPRLPSEAVLGLLSWDTPEGRPPMVARWLRHTLSLRAASAPAQGYSVDDLLQLANDTRKGWVDALPDGMLTLDVLPLSWQATDWLVGAWGALQDDAGEVERGAFLDALSCGVELQHVQLDELKVIQAAIGAEKERVVLMDVLAALKQAAAMEDRIADSQPYLERLQVRDRSRSLLAMPCGRGCSCPQECISPLCASRCAAHAMVCVQSRTSSTTAHRAAPHVGS